MAYMSDLDLATLHKTRLEEKVNYKLSWLAQQKERTSHPSIDYSVPRSKTYNTHRKLSRTATGNESDNKLCRTGNGSMTSNETKQKGLNGTGKQVENSEMNGSKSKHKEPECDIYVKNIEKELIMRDSVGAELVDNLSDDGYFSSETRRRRSGTWP